MQRLNEKIAVLLFALALAAPAAAHVPPIEISPAIERASFDLASPARPDTSEVLPLVEQLRSAAGAAWPHETLPKTRVWGFEVLAPFERQPASGLSRALRQGYAKASGENGEGRGDYEIHSLYLAASEESKAKLLTGFKAAPFVEPATGLVYLRHRWYDASTGTFLTPDPAGMRDSSNLYAGFGLDPVNNSDPTGEYIETAWDVASLGLGIYQISQWDENTSGWAKTLDVVGVVVDAAAIVVPLVPGGVGAGLKAYRAADAAHDLYTTGRTIDRTLDVVQGVDQGLNTIQASINIAEDVRNGNVGWGTGLNALQAGIGWRSMSTRGIGGYRLDFSGGHATASMNGLGGVRITRVSRETAGVASGGENLPVITGRWFRGSAGNAGLVPRQIADRLRGREFESFDDFRRAFWIVLRKNYDQATSSARTRARRRTDLGLRATKSAEASPLVPGKSPLSWRYARVPNVTDARRRPAEWPAAPMDARIAGYAARVYSWCKPPRTAVLMTHEPRGNTWRFA